MEVAIAILTMAFVALAIVVIINGCELYRHKYKIEELIRDIQLLEGTQERFSEHLMKMNDLKKEIDSIKEDFTDFERDHKILDKLKDIPLQTWQIPCADPNVPCMNPFGDCINCPRRGLTGVITTNNTDKLQ